MISSWSSTREVNLTEIQILVKVGIHSFAILPIELGNLAMGSRQSAISVILSCLLFATLTLPVHCLSCPNEDIEEEEEEEVECSVNSRCTNLPPNQPLVDRNCFCDEFVSCMAIVVIL